MEDGEIRDQDPNLDPILGNTYDPSYEWPGEISTDYALPLEDNDTASLTSRPPRNGQPCFRLLVLHSSILPGKHKLVIVDGYSELQFGRDLAASGSHTPRIRLKEMEVSKLHATAYWDGAQKEWGVVDMGSKHGTFLESQSNEEKVRLSPPRVASIPKRLRHLDRLTVGSTMFLVHLHNGRAPCDQCSPHGGGDEIPLFPVQKESKKMGMKRNREISGIDAMDVRPATARDPKKALTKLKHDLLTRHEPSDRSISPGTGQYVDRSARRRALGSSSHFDAPGIRPRADSPSRKPEVDAERIASSAAVGVIAPLPTTNIGHRLLLKQGWLPGSALGATQESDEWARITEPLEVKLSVPRAGLGSTRGGNIDTNIETSSDWRENGKLRRWGENN